MLFVAFIVKSCVASVAWWTNGKLTVSNTDKNKTKMCYVCFLRTFIKEQRHSHHIFIGNLFQISPLTFSSFWKKIRNAINESVFCLVQLSFNHNSTLSFTYQSLFCNVWPLDATIEQNEVYRNFSSWVKASTGHH